MRSQRIIVTIVLTVFFCMPVYLISNEDGPLPRRTGGPFPGEKSCIDLDCHSGMLNEGPGRVSVSINGLPADQYLYTPGETVPVVVRIEDPDQMRWGFELSARAPDGCTQAGNFATSPNETQSAVRIYNTNPTDDVPECPANPVPLQFPTHMVAKAGPGGANYEFNWTAPGSSVGPITFAAAGNAANGMRDPEGDRIYTTSAVIQPAAVEPAPKPLIGSGGVVLATQTPVVASASPNAILSVYGVDFAPAGTFAQVEGVDTEGKVGTRLANTCVEINGTRTPMFGVFVAQGPNPASQINLQSPTNPGQGPASVVVIRACGTPQENRSDPEMVNMAAVSPAFFNAVNNVDGVNPIAAIHGGDGPPIDQAAPAAPGEFISLFATGFGPTDPLFEAGEIPEREFPGGGQAGITGEVSVTIGGLPVRREPEVFFYAGVAPCCAGLYQLVVEVPPTAPDGNLPVVVTVNGISSPNGPYIRVARP